MSFGSRKRQEEARPGAELWIQTKILSWVISPHPEGTFGKVWRFFWLSQLPGSALLTSPRWTHSAQDAPMTESYLVHSVHSVEVKKPRDFPGKNTGLGCHFLLQGVFLTEELNPSLCLAGRFFTIEPPGKPSKQLFYEWKCTFPLKCRIFEGQRICPIPCIYNSPAESRCVINIS